MTIEVIVARYGLAALFAGAALEGEAAVIAGGVLAHKGLLSLPLAMLVAALGSFTADQGWFYAGRHFRDHRWIAAARGKPAFAKAVAAFERRPTGFIFAFRFLYGLRTVSPIAIGSTQVSARLYAIVNGISAACWGVIFSGIGYVFGHSFERVLGRLAAGRHLWWVVGGLLVAGIAFGGWRWYKARHA
ncbi:DedA family protein [uncultured Sphingomonas sp.]|uniref:DedA family protein n=1 Tax=uncultured Sphingomonas sp. TaxID=158754 RepID=UPI003749ADAA